jgi:hypothetical protein
VTKLEFEFNHLQLLWHPKRRNQLEETAGEAQLVEAQGKSLVEPKGKCHKKNLQLPGLSHEKTSSYPFF